MRALDLSGHRFGKLVAQSRAGSSRSGVLWRCVCDCGGETIALTDNLRSGNTRTCGCSRKGNKRALRHGFAPRERSATYRSWSSMKTRCDNPSSDGYEHYGARGISYDRRWSDFTNFLEDMGAAPEGATIDRIDNSKGYSKENCRWATKLEQTRNRRNTITVEYKGKVRYLADIAKELGVSYSSVRHRIVRSLPLGQDEC